MRRALVAAVIGAVACGLRDVPGPPGQEQIVVQGVLSAQRAEQILWIERTIPAGEPVGGELRPLATPPARIEVHDSAGTVFTFQPDAGNPARFVAAFTPVPGVRYDLLLEAGPHVLRAVTRVPDPVTIVEPVPDTVVLTRGLPLTVRWAGPIRPVRFMYSDTVGAPIFFSGTWVEGDTVTSASTAYISAPTFLLWVGSFDSVTARIGDPYSNRLDFGLERQFRGNVTGGVGFFGAATSDHVVVRLQ